MKNLKWIIIGDLFITFELTIVTLLFISAFNLIPAKDTLFWLSSTIAQSFLAFIGVIAIFLIYKINNVREKRLRVIETIEKKLKEYDKIFYLEKRDYNSHKEIEEEINEKIHFDNWFSNANLEGNLSGILTYLYREFYFLKQIEQNIKEEVFYPIYYNVCLFILSISILSFGYSISTSDISLSWAFILLLIIFSIITLLRDVEFIKGLLKEKIIKRFS